MVLRRSAALVLLGACLLPGCDPLGPEEGRSLSVGLAWSPADARGLQAGAAAVQLPPEFLWAAETLEVEILDAAGGTRTRSWPVGPSGVSVDATFRIADGPFRTRATVTSNGARRLLAGEQEASADQVTVALQAPGPVLALTPLVARPTEPSPATVRVWNLGSDTLAWDLGTLEPPNTSCVSGRCLAFRIPDRSGVPPGGFRDVLVAGYDTPGGTFDLTFLGGERDPGADRVILPIEAGPAEPVGRLVVRVSLAGSPVAGATVEIVGPPGIFRTAGTDAQGQASFAGLPFGSYEVQVFVPGGPGGEAAASLDAFARDVRVEVAL